MALIARVSRLFKADLHAVLDRLEEPLSLLKQSIREMEDAVAARECEVQALRLDRLCLEKQARESEAHTAELDRQLDLCFADGTETLARQLIRRKLGSERRSTSTRARLDAVGDALERAATALERERGELEHMRQKADCFATPALDPRRAAPDESLGVADDEVEVAYLRERQRRVTP